MMNDHPQTNTLKLRRLGVDTRQEYVVYMRADCHICISEGFEALTRLQVTVKGRTIIATLNVLHGDLLLDGEAGLSESAWKVLGAVPGDIASFHHLQPVSSMSLVRAKMYGHQLDDEAMSAIIADITAGKYSDVELAAFITACTGDRLDLKEIVSLTKAMIRAGERLDWDEAIVVDKHCVGGLPGNRTTPIVVAIIAAAGLTIPKTSSRAITSPAGTADTMETMAPVQLSLQQIREVVRKEGGCVAWGGAVQLSPADDRLIRIEKALDIDSEGQMIASVLSKKAAAGATHVVIDIPVGTSAKIRNQQEAARLKTYFQQIGMQVGLEVEVMITDGSQPVGRGIGPALEAIDVLAVLRQTPDRPEDLEQRAVSIAGSLLELAGQAGVGNGREIAQGLLVRGKAWEKFKAICEAQGGFREPQSGHLQESIVASVDGKVRSIDNRRLAKLAKLLGAPLRKGAGIMLQCKLGQRLKSGQTMFVMYAETPGELAYAKLYLQREFDFIINLK
ncbi:MAG: thymidine phosphorylase family protein [Saprospiraceae bacterium]